MVAYTGDPKVDFVLSQPDVQYALNNRRINRRGQVGLLAGADEKDIRKTHVHEDVPQGFPDGVGGVYSPDDELHPHEVIERWVQENGYKFPGILGLKPEDFVQGGGQSGQPRVKYAPAHYDFATPAGQAALEAAVPQNPDIWRLHNAHMAGTYGAIKDKPVTASPPTVYRAPYVDDGKTDKLKPSKAADMDYGYGGLLGNTGMGGLLGGFPQIGYDPSMGNYSSTGGNFQFAQPQSPTSYGQQFPNIAPSGAQDASGTQYPGGGQYSAMGAPPFDLGNVGPQEPVSNPDPNATAQAGAPPVATAPPPPSSSPAQSGGFFGPQNADILSTLGGALLQAPTLRQGLGIAGQQLPGVLRQSRANNATVDWLLNNQNLDPATRNMFMNNPQIAQQVAERMALPQWQWTAIGRDDIGNPTYGWVNPSTREVLGANGKPIDASHLGGGSGVVGSIADGVEKGIIPPDQLGKYKVAPAVEAELARRGFNVSRAQAAWIAEKKNLQSLNGQSQVRLKQQVDYTIQSLDLIDQLADKWNGSRFPIKNRFDLEAAKQGAYGEEEKQDALRLEQQIANVTADVAGVFRGGNAATEEAFKQANKTLSSDWDAPTLHALIKQLRLDLQYRLNAINDTVQPAGVADNPYAQSGAAGATPAVPGTNAAAPVASTPAASGGVISLQDWLKLNP